MVTVRQFSRGVGRTIRAVEREARRAERRRIMYEKVAAKQAMLEASAEAAADYERLIDDLTGAHRITFRRRDWSTLAAEAPPDDPIRVDARERAAASALANYQPGWFARTFGLAARRRAELERAVDKARADDANAHHQAVADATRRRDEIAFAASLLALRSDAVIKAVNDHAALDEVAIEGVSVLAADGRVLAVIDALEQDDMPTQSVTLLQSGKASVKAIAAGKIAELHRDNICSSAIRVAAEFLQVVPVDAVEIIVQTDLLDRATGHIEPHPVLYARTTAQALSAVNLSMADSAPLAERLGAHFSWIRKDGFRAVDLGPFELPLDLSEEALT